MTASPFALPSLKASSSRAGVASGGGAASPQIAAGALLLEVAQMRYEEVEFFSERLVHFATKEGEKIRRAFRTRAAELLATCTVRQLRRARHTLMVLQQAEQQFEFDPLGKSDTWPTTSSASDTKWQCPQRAFEERIAYLAQKGVHDLEALAACHEVTAELAPRGFIRDKVHDVVIACLLKYVETEPFTQLRKHAMLLCDLKDREPCILARLERRLVQRARQAFHPGKLAGFVQVILDLQERGLPILDGPSPPVVDMKSATRFPALQVALLDALRVALKEWPIHRVAAEMQGAVLAGVVARPALQENVCVAATQRVHGGLHVVRDMVLRRVDARRVQEEYCHWGTLTLAMGKLKCLDFTEPIRMHILGGTEEIGSMAFCVTSVSPGANEVPPEYLGQVAGMRALAGELWKKTMDIALLLGDEAEVKSTRELMEERLQLAG